ncbi:MAG TPA: carboxypeptidase-like regulatory domain-containing protein, partial [Thermodesulfovibrionia bacterium]|nr:carboxypeptidase-like regulatory domain-containing protein [Thermodesulfovibrionia bacterium]
MNQSDEQSKSLESQNKTTQTDTKRPAWVLIVSVSSGLVFLAVLLIIAVFIPKPAQFQIFVFRVVLALASAAFGATIPGFLKIQVPLWAKGLISAGGALGLFVLIYTVNPPALIGVVDSTIDETPVVQPLAGTILDQSGEPLPDVTVTIPEFDKTATTDSQGRFSFEIKAPAQ